MRVTTNGSSLYRAGDHNNTKICTALSGRDLAALAAVVGRFSGSSFLGVAGG